MRFTDDKVYITVSEMMNFVQVVNLFDNSVARRMRDVCNYHIMKYGTDKVDLEFNRDFSRYMPVGFDDDFFSDDVIRFNQYVHSSKIS